MLSLLVSLNGCP
uniref:Uncharacterized protein n=1 Tax=Anguilla anguilla TaxID=7936 RepID=A0A0E9V5H7_ANGAN